MVFLLIFTNNLIANLDTNRIGIFMEHEFDHAGFVETSLMLAISDKVKMKKAKKGLDNRELEQIRTVRS